jgi:hypothetical protein
MNKKSWIFSFIVIAIGVLVIDSCKKETTSEPLEPISVVLPDSSIVFRFPSDSVPIQLKFTTDRPINWILGKYDIDTSRSASYTATYPDTLFFQRLDTTEPRVNRYEYSVTYFVPDTLRPFDHIRFRVSFEAGSSTFATGQNYPAGKVGASKEFRVDVR